MRLKRNIFAGENFSEKSFSPAPPFKSFQKGKYMNIFVGSLLYTKKRPRQPTEAQTNEIIFPFLIKSSW
jgi:hypothetical protein